MLLVELSANRSCRELRGVNVDVIVGWVLEDVFGQIPINSDTATTEGETNDDGAIHPSWCFMDMHTGHFTDAHRAHVVADNALARVHGDLGGFMS